MLDEFTLAPPAPLVGIEGSTAAPPTSARILRWLQHKASSRIFIFAAAMAPFAFVGALVFANTTDDPLITLRYASNLVHHGQPVFNLGERVEGYTSPLHLLLAAAILTLPGGLALFKLKLASLILGGAAVWQVTRLAQLAGLSRFAQVSAVAAVAGSWNFMLSATNGLETSLVAFLATGAAASLSTHDSHSAWWRPALWTALLAVARPDAVLLIIALAAVSAARRDVRPWWRRILWTAGPASALAALLCFRALYYGELVPNTYFAKHLSVGASIASGIVYLVSSQPLTILAVLLLGALILGPRILAGRAWQIRPTSHKFRRRRPAVAYACAVVIAQVIFVLASGGDWMKGGRFFAPAIPAGTVLVFLGVELALSATNVARPSLRRRTLMVILAVAVLVAPVSSSYIAPSWRLTHGLTDRNLISAGNYVWSPIWMTAAQFARCLRPGQSVAYSEVGLFGYEHPNLRLIDTRGLTSRDIAQEVPTADKEVSGVTDRRWFLKTSPVGRILARARPEMIISFDASPSQLPGRWILGGLYRRLTSFPEPQAKKTVFVYLRRNVACSINDE
jgi:hypothetical protein